MVNYDHTRAVVALELKIKSILVRVHHANDLLPEDMVGRFGSSKTWGDATAYRAANQKPPLPPTGTPTPPKLNYR